MSITCDNSTSFKSTEMTDFFVQNGIHVHYVLPYSSQSAGIIENRNRQIRQCSDHPDQNVSDPDRLLCLLYIFVAAIFLRFGGGEIKPLSFCQPTHRVASTLFRAATPTKKANFGHSSVFFMFLHHLKGVLLEEIAFFRGLKVKILKYFIK